MTSSQTVWKRAVWAVDPFAKDADLQRSALQTFQLLAHDRNVVEPVYLLSVYPNLEHIIPQTEGMAVEKFRSLVEPVRYVGALSLKIIPSIHATIHAEVQALVKYAKESGADLIIASTRAKAGPYRWLVGSFTETLMLYSDVPLLVVNPACESKSRIDEIVFPTDFSQESRAAFDRACRLALSMDRSVTIFHKIPSSNATLFYTDLVASPIYEVTLRTQLEFAQSQARDWQEHAHSMGVTVRVEIRSACTQSVADALLDYTENRNCMIAMAAKSGPISVALLGATTRRVVRGSAAPVWIVRA